MVDCHEGLESEFWVYFFLKLLVVSCVLYGRIARLKVTGLCSEFVGVLVGLVAWILGRALWIVRFAKMR